jgi:hypothetical protein
VVIPIASIEIRTGQTRLVEILDVLEKLDQLTVDLDLYPPWREPLEASDATA